MQPGMQFLFFYFDSKLYHQNIFRVLVQTLFHQLKIQFAVQLMFRHDAIHFWMDAQFLHQRAVSNVQHVLHSTPYYKAHVSFRVTVTFVDKAGFVLVCIARPGCSSKCTWIHCRWCKSLVKDKWKSQHKNILYTFTPNVVLFFLW